MLPNLLLTKQKKKKMSVFSDALILMAVWSPIKPSFWNSPASQRLFSRHLPEEGVWPATLICSSAATRSLIRSERGIELSQDEDMTSSAHSMSMIGRLTCRSGMLPGISLCGSWTLPLNRGQQRRWHPGETHHLLLKDRIIKVGHTGTLPSQQACVCGPDVLILCMCVFPLDMSGQQPERSPEIHPSDRDDQHQQPIFSLDHVHSGSCARQRHHCTVRFYNKGKGK